jgi:hypothetical protein
MAIDGALVDGTTEETLYIGADHSVVMTVYSNSGKTTIQDIAGWTIVLEIRKKDTSPTALLTKTGTVSGTFNATPGSNTQKCTFTLSDDDLAATVFTGDEFTGRYSIWRTDAGSEQPLRFGDCTITRTTRT